MTPTDPPPPPPPPPPAPGGATAGAPATARPAPPAQAAAAPADLDGLPDPGPAPPAPGGPPPAVATATGTGAGPAVAGPVATGPVVAGGGARLPSPFAAVLGYTLRACLPAKRWSGVLLPCLGAVMFGFLATLPDIRLSRAFAAVAEQGLFGLIVPLTCLVIGDAVLGADIRAGTFPLTWLSPVSFRTIVLGRWLGGWLIALVTLVPALVIATLVAGVPEGAGAIAIAGATGSAAYIGVFVMIGAAVRRAAVWSLAVVFLVERLLGGVLSGVAQLSPLWEAQQVYAGLAPDSAGARRLLRDGMPNGWSAVLRLAIILAVSLGVATWRMRRLQPTGGDE